MSVKSDPYHKRLLWCKPCTMSMRGKLTPRVEHVPKRNKSDVFDVIDGTFSNELQMDPIVEPNCRPLNFLK